MSHGQSPFGQPPPGGHDPHGQYGLTPHGLNPHGLTPYGQSAPCGGPPQQRPPHRKQPGPAAKKGGATKWVLISLGAGLLALVLVAGIGVWAYFRNLNAPSEAVGDYLEAIIDGDSARALGMLNSQPADTSLITEAVLQKSQDLAPFTDLDIARGATDDGSVMVDLTVGGEEALWWFEVTETGAGWKVSTPEALKTDLGEMASTAGLAVNGAKPADAAALMLLPGKYQLSAETPNVEFDEEGLFASDTGVLPSAALTPAGTEVAQQAVDAYYTRCAASTAAMPPNCPFEAGVGSYDIVGAVKWTVASPPLVDVTPRLQADGTVTASAQYSLTVQHQHRVNGKVVPYEHAQTKMDRLVVNVLGAEPTVAVDR